MSEHRLIYADELYEALANKLTWLMKYGNYVYLKVGRDIEEAISEQPTAYDVDKVCEELKFATRKGVLRACDFTGILGAEDYKGAFVSTQQAIDIVRRGGLND